VTDSVQQGYHRQRRPARAAGRPRSCALVRNRRRSPPSRPRSRLVGGRLVGLGEYRDGARREITEDPGWQGPAYQTCANAAAVCRAFEVSRRRETLSFSHHETVAAPGPAGEDRLLDAADREGWSRQELRAAVRSAKRPVGRSLKSPTR